MVTVWSKSSQRKLQAAYNYIKQYSPQNAQKVRDEIIERTIQLVKNPEIYPPDKYKANNDGTYRAFELHRYRISYRILNDAIIIVRMRHTSQSPLQY